MTTPRRQAARPAGEGIVPRQFPLVPKRSPPRVGADLCVRPPPLRVTRPRADTQVGPFGPYRFDCSLHQPLKTGRGQSPAPTVDEHPTPLRDLPGHPKPRLPQPKTPCMTAGTPPSSSVPRPNVKNTPVRLRTGVSKRGGRSPPLVVSRRASGGKSQGSHRKEFCGGKRRSSGMSEPVPFGQRRGIWSL